MKMGITDGDLVFKFNKYLSFRIGHGLKAMFETYYEIDLRL